MKTTLTASLTALALALMAGCASQATQESEPAPAPAPGVSTAKATPQAAPAASAPRGAASTVSVRAMPQARSIYYEYDKSEIGAEGRGLIEAHAQYLRAHPDVEGAVEGNADERGSAEYNLALGQRRAEDGDARMRSLGVSRIASRP